MERSANIRLCQYILRGVVGSLGLCSLRFDAIQFGSGISFRLLLLKESELGISASDGILRLQYFAR